jgi:UDP-N-acetylglucosamine--N-acetylmuramyl-(pentapeptide) pyrophosphoryl-undecaprenol N-acetylglucosamine transferase
MKQRVCLVAGGTGGHINAALSIGEFLNGKYDVVYITGTRFLDKKLFQGQKTIYLDSKPLRTSNPFILLKNILLNFYTFINFSIKIRKIKPKYIIGAGGYVCGPSLLAAWFQFIPTYIVEQNAVVGVTNKLLSKIARKTFTNFENTKGLENNKNVVVSGNPVRNSIRFHEQQIEDQKLKILVFGGSLGATQINEAIKELLEKDFTVKICVKHQVGKGNITNSQFNDSKISYEQLEYIDDMNHAYAWANIIIARSGASTISELKIIGKPAILIPYPAATDNHQYYNALMFMQESKSYVSIIDNHLDTKELANQLYQEIYSIFNNQELLKAYSNNKSIPATEVIISEIEKNV